jgi:hypothetical protein
MSSSSKKIDLKRDFAAGIYLSEVQNPPPPPARCTVYNTRTCMQYTYSHIEEWGGGELNQREVEKGNRSQRCVENTNMTDCISCL